MKKHISTAVSILLGLAVLASCGKITADDAESSSSAKEGSSSSSEAVIDTSSEEEKENEPVEKVLASVKAENTMGAYISSPVPDADLLYAEVRKLLDPELGIDGYDDPDTLTVAFKADDEKFVLSYCGDDVFAWRHTGGSAYYMLEHGDAEKLRSRMAAYAALGLIFEDEYHVDISSVKSRLLTSLADRTKNGYYEHRGYYIDDSSGRLYFMSASGDDLYYSHYTYPCYSTDDDSYDFLSRGGEKYYRKSNSTVYYETDVFEGDFDIESLPAQITRDYEYRESFSVTADVDHTVEIYDGDGDTAYLLFDDYGNLCGAWTLCLEGISVMNDYSIDTEYIDFDEMFSYAKEHSGEAFHKQEGDNNPLTDGNWLAYDTNKFGLFDLSGEIVEGKELDDSDVVRSWREYMSGGNPFTIEYRFAGAGRNQYEICSFDGSNHYYRDDMDIHDGDRDTGMEEILIGDTLYQTVYYTDEFDTREFTAYPLSMYGDDGVGCPIDLLFDTKYDGEMKRAYEVTIDGEDYICEEWALYLDRLYKVYIKDGEIVAYLGDFYKKPVVYTITRLEKSGDSSLIKKPANAKAHQSYD